MAQNTFWKNFASWPTDPPGWLFLARAANQLADAIGGGQDLNAFEVFNELAYPVWAMDKAPPPPVPLSITSSNSAPPRIVEARPELSDEARQQLRDRFSLASSLVGQTQDQIRAWAEGPPFLATGTRPRMGGRIAPLAPEVWSTQHLSSRFAYCQIDPRDPFSNAFAGDRYQHMFVKRDQFEALVRVEITKDEREGDRVVAGLQKPIVVSPQQPVSIGKARPGRTPSKQDWERIAAALAVVASCDAQGVEPGRSASSIYEKMEEVLQARLPDGARWLSKDSVQDAITLAQEWISRGMPE